MWVTPECSRPLAPIQGRGETSLTGQFGKRTEALFFESQGPQVAHVTPASPEGGCGPLQSCLNAKGKFISGVQSQQALVARTTKPHSPIKPLPVIKAEFGSPLTPLLVALALSAWTGDVCLKGLIRCTQISKL